MTRHAAGLLLVLLALALPAAAQTGLTGRTLSVGATPAAPVGTTVRLDGLGTAGGTLVLFTDTDGDVFERILAATDIPAAFTRDDVAETITQAWTFSAGITGPLAVTTRVSTPEIATASGALTFAPANGLTELASTSTALRPASNYGPDLGAPSRKFRSIHGGELFLETIVAQQRITTMGGRFTVTPSNILTRDLASGTASPTTMCVKNNSFLLHVGGVEHGSKLLMEKDGTMEWFSVNSTTVPTVDATFGDYCYDVNRDLDGTGQNAWTAGDGIVDTGKTGSGMIDQFAVRGLTSALIEGPSIDFLVRTGAAWNALATRTSVGNLNGRYGFAADTFGFAAGDEADANLIAVAGSIKLRDGTTDKIVLDGSTGDVSLSGDLMVAAGGNIEIAGALSLTPTDGLLLQDASADSDYPRMVRWSGGAFMRGIASTLLLKTGLASSGRYGQVTLQGAPSVGGEVAFSSYDGVSTSSASFGTHTSGASTLFAGNLIPSTASSLLDGTAVIGLSSARYDNINLALDPNAAPAFVITNKGGGGADANSGLGYIVGASKTVTIGCGTLIFTGGVLTGGTCP